MQRKKSRGLPRVILNNIYLVKLIFKNTPLYGISIIVDALRHNIINFLEQTILVSFVLETIEFHLPYSRIVKCIIFFILIDLIAAALTNGHERYIKVRYIPIVQEKLKLLLYQKARDLDLAYYDDNKYYNDFVLAVSESEKAIERAEQLLKMFFGSITIIICYGSFFASKDIASILFVAVSLIMRFFISNISNKIRYELRLKENVLERKREYIRRVFYLNDYAKELRLHKKASNELYQIFDEVNQELVNLYKETSKKRFWAEFVSKHISSDFMMNIIYVLHLILQATILHSISYSDVVVLYNSAANMRRGLNDITNLGSYMIETSLYIERIKSFLAYESTITSCKKYEIPKEAAELELRNVSFGYDKSKFILKNISLTIKPNDRVALVGYNGSGKTTLIKLIMRLYDPLEGDIYLNGINIKDYDLEEYRNYIGVIFQDFRLFATTILENVAMDDSIKVMEEEVMAAICKGDFDSVIRAQKSGLYTQVTKEFDSEGTEFSGGEAQKLAISRVYYKKSNLLIMDEPSSALDPVSEYQINKAMYDVADNKTLIFISHRLFTTRDANHIYMLEQGRIIEDGTHEELLRLGKKYKEMWEIQASKYG